MGFLDGLNRFGDRADLIQLDQDTVAATLANRTPSGSGRYLKTRVRLVAATSGETPLLYDLTVGTAGYLPQTTMPLWYVSAGEDINGNWPDIIQLKGAFCRSLDSFPAQPTLPRRDADGTRSARRRPVAHRPRGRPR